MCSKLSFFWNENGTSMNYDYMNRPRRQNFSGMLMENGAFYINTVSNIKKLVIDLVAKLVFMKCLIIQLLKLTNLMIG